MTRDEFMYHLREIAGEQAQDVPQADYDMIEQVYMYHPSIDEVDGKYQIASLYHTFGMRIIQDMLPSAQAAEAYEARIEKARRVLYEARQAVDEARQALEAIRAEYADFMR